jgi:hypothetical protein
MTAHTPRHVVSGTGAPGGFPRVPFRTVWCRPRGLGMMPTPFAENEPNAR